MSDSRIIKAMLRAEALARRSALSPDEHRRGSIAAASRIRPMIRPGDTVALFWPMRDEIDPLPLIDDIRDRGGEIALPAVVDRVMTFRQFASPEDLEPGPFGTRHPPDDARILIPDLIVTPLAAFDRRGGRIGYGAGYYDRALAAMAASTKPFRAVGMAFACQEVPEVPIEAHDVNLAEIATEKELIDTGVMA